MPAKRKGSRLAQVQPQPAQSDYDTDTANLTDTQHASIMPSVPAPPVRSIAELNLLVLRRWYPEVESIIAIAPYAVIYNLNRTVGEWEKGETEGSLFVCSLAPDPYERYRIIILNRKSIENFTMDIVSTETISFESGFIIAQIAEDNAAGIWIFSDGDTQPTMAEATWNVIESCAKRAEQFPAPAQNGHQAQSYAYGLDGTTTDSEAETQDYERWDTLAQNPGATAAGTSIDLAALFAKPSQQTTSQAPAMPFSDSLLLGQPARFTAPADTDFFRSSQQGSSTQQQQKQHHAPQQNALLDLFKNAKQT